jgi:hypothetical protein
MSESSGSALMEGTNRRRWLISAAIVLLLHAGIAVAVLTWRHAASAPPVMVDLTPAPSESEPSAAQPAPPVAHEASPQQTAPEQKTESASAAAPTSSPAGDHAAPTPPAEHNEAASTQSKPDNPATARDETATKAEQNSGPAEASRGVNAPQLPASPRGTEAESGAGGTTISGGGISRAPEAGALGGRAVASAPAPAGLAPAGPMANMPLDTSITVQPPVHGHNGAGPFNHSEIGPLASRETGPEGGSPDQRPTSVFRSAKPFGVPDVPRNSLAPNNNPALPGVGLNNAPGAHVQDRARAAMAKAMNGGQTVKNAIGSSVTASAAPYSTQRVDNGVTNGGAVSGIGSPMNVASRGDATGPNPGNGVARNAIGVTANFRPLLPRANAGETKTGAVAVAGHEMPNAPIINGHDLSRPVAGPSVIGGPARRGGTGMLNGSDFHLRHP